jgi:class 3 adenylate cyclase
VRNEGLVTAVVVDPAGQMLAFADAVVDPQDWLSRLEQPYQPDSGTGLLTPGDESRIWTSVAKGVYVFAVPVTSAAGAAPSPATGGAPDTPAAPPGAVAAGSAPFYGAVYLAMSQGLVDRTVARAIAFLILMAGGLVALGAFFAIFFAAFLTNPIRQLTQGVQAIAGGDFNMQMRLSRSDELGELNDAFNRMARGLAERELMRGAFSTYVSKDLLAEIIRNPDAMKLGGSRKEGTVMFTLFGNHHELPALMARLDPEAFVKVINDYLEAQARLVFDHKGHLDKFVGEEVVAVWGSAAPLPDHAAWAVKCALAIETAVARLNQRRERQGQMTTSISIGINSGSMIAGNMGSEDGKRDYTVISSDVNYAARLAGAGATVHGGEIWVSESTYELVKASVVLREKREVVFKGIPDPQPVYIVAGIK